MKIDVKGTATAAPYYIAAAHAAVQYRAFAEAVGKMRDEAGKLDAAASAQFSDIDAALKLLKPIFN